MFIIEFWEVDGELRFKVTRGMIGAEYRLALKKIRDIRMIAASYLSFRIL